MKKAKFKLGFYKSYQFRWMPYLLTRKLMWKDKFGSPRCEWEPHFCFEWLWFGCFGSWGDDQYWEQWLWVNIYYKGDYEKAKAEWGWISMETRQSTWIEY